MFTPEDKKQAYSLKFSMNPHPICYLKDYIEQKYFHILDETSPKVISTSISEHIPKHILLFWHDKGLPEDVGRSVEAIRQHNPNYTVSLYSSEMAYDYLHQHYGEEFCRIYERRCVHPAMKSDFFRICYLLREGGLYVDIDIQCHSPLDKIFEFQDFDCFFLYAKGEPYCIENGFIACTPKNKVIERVLDQIYQHLTKKYHYQNVWEYTGPAAVSMAILYLLADKILGDVNAEAALDRLALGVASLVYRSYDFVDFAYKHDEGNWRHATLPNQLYLR